jgi:predicted lipoprotein
MKTNRSFRHRRRRPVATLAWIGLAAGSAWLQPALAQPVAKDAFLRDIARNVIAADYRDLAGKCRALTVSAGELVQAPSSESLEKTRRAWLAALLAARQVQWLETGPIADREYLSTFYYSKVLPVRLDGVLNSDRAIDHSYVEEMGAASKGLFGLEYLLYEQRPDKNPKDASPAKGIFSAHVQRRCQFVLGLANDLQRKADEISKDWAGSTAQDASAKFAAGQAALNTLVNQMAKIVEDLAENHVNFVLQLPAPVMNQLDRIEGARSRTSLSQLVAILRGVHRMYRGGEELGIDDYLRGLNSAVETRVEQQFQKAVSALEAIGLPIEEAVTARRESVQTAYQAVHDLEVLFKTELASALGVTITINSNDGD